MMFFKQHENSNDHIRNCDSSSQLKIWQQFSKSLPSRNNFQMLSLVLTWIADLYVLEKKKKRKKETKKNKKQSALFSFPFVLELRVRLTFTVSIVTSPRYSMIYTIERFHSRGQQLCKFNGTKESVCIRKEFNSHRTSLEHQDGRRFIVLGHQYGRRDVMWKHSINSWFIKCSEIYCNCWW